MTSLSEEEFNLALRQCETEPIHQIGQIQPHGAMLVLSSDTHRMVLQASNNLTTFIEVPTQSALGKPLSELLGIKNAEFVEELIKNTTKNISPSGVIFVKNRQASVEMQARVFASGDLFVLELIRRTDDTQGEELIELLLPIQRSLLMMSMEDDIYRYFNNVASLVRDLTGYDRIMVYRFDTNWEGEVIAESKVEAVPSYFGVRFPASDIPPQARRLYTTNLVRQIADTKANPVPVLPELNPLTKQPLDMTHSLLRSLSPVHVEYLSNMGVQSSMSISLLQNGRLWGLIACHHMTPKQVSNTLQEASSFVSQIISPKLSLIEVNESRNLALEANRAISKFIKHITIAPEDAITEYLLPELIELLDSTGVVMAVEGKLYTHGVVPSENEISDLFSWLGTLPAEEIFTCNNLGQRYSPASNYAAMASGILVIPLSADMKNCIVLFRKERLRTVSWGGNPDKIFHREPSGLRLSPRKSFEIWKETWSGRSSSWSHVEIETAKYISLALTQALSQQSLRIISSVFEASQEAILIADEQKNIIAINSAFTRITGYTREEVIGKNPKILSSGHHGKDFYAKIWQSLHQDLAWRGEIWNRTKSGEIYAEQLSITAILGSDGMITHYVAVFSDITKNKDREAKLSRAAHFDLLTGIPNRVLLADRMQQAISQTSRDQHIMAVCYLDLDGFKAINDTFGHQAGDEVLISIAKRIGGSIRGGDTVARLGGDEFVFLLLGLENIDQCVGTIERLLEEIAKPIIINENFLSVSASIGVSIYPRDKEPDILLTHADQAMYLAKQSGRNRFQIYDDDLKPKSSPAELR